MRPHTTNERGFTILEVVISTVIFTLLVAACYAILTESMRVEKTFWNRSEMDAMGEQAMAFMCEELRETHVGTFTVKSNTGTNTTATLPFLFTNMNPGAPFQGTPYYPRSISQHLGLFGTSTGSTAIVASSDYVINGGSFGSFGKSPVTPLIEIVYARAAWNSAGRSLACPLLNTTSGTGMGSILWDNTSPTSGSWTSGNAYVNQYYFILEPSPTPGENYLIWGVTDQAGDANPPTLPNGHTQQVLCRHCEKILFEMGAAVGSPVVGTNTNFGTSLNTGSLPGTNQVRITLWMVAPDINQKDGKGCTSRCLQETVTIRN
jgi:Prokaryotic N-terminal methylation motif